MFEQCLQVYDACSTDVSAYTEVVVDVSDESAYAVEAVVGYGADEVHQNLLSHFGLNERQCPRLLFGPGLKGKGPLFVKYEPPI